jgi:hypothetical protein
VGHRLAFFIFKENTMNEKKEILLFLPGGWLFPRKAADPRCHRRIHGCPATVKKKEGKDRIIITRIKMTIHPTLCCCIHSFVT